MILNKLIFKKSTIKMKKRLLILELILFVLLSGCHQSQKVFTPNVEDSFAAAEENGKLVNEAYERCLRYVKGWLAEADSATRLIPRNLEEGRDIWNAKDCAADNYPFMVLTAAILDQKLFNGLMLDMLETETELTSRLGSLPDTYSFSKKGFVNNDTILSDIIFGSSEYVKDGLIPLTEWLGPSPWSERMISIIDDIWKFAPVETPYGNICSDNPEVNGEMLQALSRLYWATGKIKYLDWAIRLGDYYLLDDNHPTRNFRVLRLRDHGCEIVSGLCELYATVTFTDKYKKEVYQVPLYEMLDRILETGRNTDGLFYNSIDPVAGKPVNEGIADNFGYTLNGYYTIYLIDNINKYREPVIKALKTLNEKYRNFAWEGTSSDGYADAIEGTLNLYAREPVPEAREWIDSEIRVMWDKQQPSGIIEGWHGDGNFARTTIMYALWKTEGTYLDPWRDDLEIGAKRQGDTLFVSAYAAEDWKGILKFDKKRHHEYLHLPVDWPRINQFPEYFIIEEEKNYSITRENGHEKIITGKELMEGYSLKIKKGKILKLIIAII